MNAATFPHRLRKTAAVSYAQYKEKSSGSAAADKETINLPRGFIDNGAPSGLGGIIQSNWQLIQTACHVPEEVICELPLALMHCLAERNAPTDPRRCCAGWYMGEMADLGRSRTGPTGRSPLSAEAGGGRGAPSELKRWDLRKTWNRPALRKSSSSRVRNDGWRHCSRGKSRDFRRVLKPAAPHFIPRLKKHRCCSPMTAAVEGSTSFNPPINAG